MKIRLLCVGKLTERHFKDGVAEYKKRMEGYGGIEIIEVKDVRAPERLSKKEEEQVLKKEGDALLQKLRDDEFLVLLDIGAKTMSSEEFASQVGNWKHEGRHLAFIIGGSLGVSEEVRRRANVRLSFSPMTFPHQLMRVIFMEQLYRAHRILENHPYHK